MATSKKIVDGDNSDGKGENSFVAGVDVCVSCELNIRATELECHISSEHLSYYPFCCQSCDMRFPSKRQLMHHAIEDHSISCASLQIRCNLDESKHMKLKKMVLASRKNKLVATNKSPRIRKSSGNTTESMEPSAKRPALAQSPVLSKSQTRVVFSSSDSSDSDTPQHKIKIVPPMKINLRSSISPPPADPMSDINPQTNCDHSATSSASNCSNGMNDVKDDDSGVASHLFTQPNVTPKDENVPVAKIVSVEVPIILEFVPLFIGKNGSHIKKLRKTMDCKITVPRHNDTSIQLCLIEPNMKVCKPFSRNMKPVCSMINVSKMKGGLEKNVYRAQKIIETKMNDWKDKQSALICPVDSQNRTNCDPSSTLSKSNLPNKLSGGKVGDSGVPADFLSKPNVTPKAKSKCLGKIVSVKVPVIHGFAGIIKKSCGIRGLRDKLDCEIAMLQVKRKSVPLCLIKGLEKNVSLAQKGIEKMIANWQRKQITEIGGPTPSKIAKCDSQLKRNRCSSSNRKSTNLDCSLGNSKSCGLGEHSFELDKCNESPNGGRSSSDMILSDTVRLSEAQYNSLVATSRKRLVKQMQKDARVAAKFRGRPHNTCVLQGWDKSSDIQLAKQILHETIRCATSQK